MRRSGCVPGALVAYFCAAPVHFLPAAQAQGRADDGYVNSQICASCHQNEWETYRHTGMARSFYRPTPENTIADYTRKNTFYHKASNTYFTTIERNGHYFQRRYQIGFDGKQTNIVEKEIDYVIGSGNHARTYLHRNSRNELIELPLGWYSEHGGYWAMNPGYDRPDHQDFRRVIGYDCMFCHNAYPEIPPGHDDPRSDQVFLNLPGGIDCQRCHGPGQKHVQLARNPKSRREDIRASIVNPSRLAPERQMEVCMQCHLETTSFPLPNSIERYERPPFSYRPGEPLADFILYFDQAPGTGHDDKFEIAGAAYRLRQSQCFLKSNGALGCTTCHNPHQALRGQQTAQHYTAVCRGCHAAEVDRLVQRGRHSASTDCVGCHMPKRRTDDVVHAVMTDHYIQRRKPARDLLAEIPERHGPDYRGEVVLYYPRALPKPEDELVLAVAQVSQSSNLSEGIARLAAAIQKYRPQRAEYYLQLGDAFRTSGKLAQSLEAYRQGLQRQPDSLAALQKIALCLSSLGQHQRAGEILKRALQLAPENASLWNQLGMNRLDQGKAADAIAAFQKAAKLDPDMPEPYNSLGAIWYAARDLPKAETALRNAIGIQSNYAEAHNNLGGVLSLVGRFDEAQYEFEAALRDKPNYAFARFNYAVALGRAGRLDEAEREVKTSLREDPNSAEAHDFLGSLLRTKGRSAGESAQALEQFREALRLRPDFSRANLDLGAMLADSGDAAGATPYLQKAARSTDRSIREEAATILRKLRTAH